jgi:hypothetical protein
MDHKLEQRRATVSLLTDLGWANGTLHIPTQQTLLDYLNATGPVVKCTRVRVPTRPDSVNFVGFRREAVQVVAPTIEELVEPTGAIGHTTPRDVTCILPSGEIQGKLEVLVNLRVSDFLRQQTSLVVLRRCVFRPHGATDPAQDRRLAVAVVNMARAIGVAQLEGSGTG